MDHRENLDLRVSQDRMVILVLLAFLVRPEKPEVVDEQAKTVYVDHQVLPA